MAIRRHFADENLSLNHVGTLGKLMKSKRLTQFGCRQKHCESLGYDGATENTDIKLISLAKCICHEQWDLFWQRMTVIALYILFVSGTLCEG